jgi:hypothetical protein
MKPDAIFIPGFLTWGEAAAKFGIPWSAMAEHQKAIFARSHGIEFARHAVEVGCRYTQPDLSTDECQKNIRLALKDRGL